LNLLRLTDVSRRFGELQALDRVSFDMPKGQLRAVIGPNGAGKTTFFNLVSGFFPVSQGGIWFDGRDITGTPAEERVRAGIVRTFQVTKVFPDLSVFENLRIGVETAEGLNARAWISRTLRGALHRRVDEWSRSSGSLTRPSVSSASWPTDFSASSRWRSL
jgi:branched-chain amino acid transport system ATP-binding protein